MIALIIFLTSGRLHEEPRLIQYHIIIDLDKQRPLLGFYHRIPASTEYPEQQIHTPNDACV